MSQFAVTLGSDGTWWIGYPEGSPVIPEKGQTKSDALNAIYKVRGITRQDLLFASDKDRVKFDADFRKAP